MSHHHREYNSLQFHQTDICHTKSMALSKATTSQQQVILTGTLSLLLTELVIIDLFSGAKLSIFIDTAK